MPGGVIGRFHPRERFRRRSPAPPPPIVKKVDPVYPPLARQARISGVVKLRATIGTDGAVKNLHVISGHPLLVPRPSRAAAVDLPASRRRDHVLVDVDFTLPAGTSRRDAPAVRQNELARSCL